MFETRSGPRPRVLVGLVAAGAVLITLLLALLRGIAYRATVSWSQGLPSWLQSVVEGVSDYGVYVLAALFLVAALVARRRGLTHLARGVAAGVGVVAAYLASELFKSVVTEQRPCRHFSVDTIATCPAPTDWAWPSNHTTVAVAIAVAVLAMSVRLGLAALPLAGLIGLSRVVLGVHYFHDVASGVILGTAMVIIFARWGTPWIARWLEYARRVPVLDALLTKGTSQERSG